MFEASDLEAGFWVGVVAWGFGWCCKHGGVGILGVASPNPPAEGRLRPPDPLQKGAWVGG